MTFETVRRFLAEILGISEDQIAPGTHLSRANGVDMTSLAKLVLRCERAFHITIHDELAPDFTRVCELCDHIDSLLADGRDDRGPITDDSRATWYYE